MKTNNSERTATMKTATHQQPGNGSEALGLLSRPVSHGQRRLAKMIAESIGGQRAYQRKNAQNIRAALAAFGGTITRFESPAQ